MTDLAAVHRDWVDLYTATAVIASAGGPTAPLTEEQAGAYGLLPDLIAWCKESWLAVPAQDRSVHYLLA